jgi:hypothetical protein
MFLGLACKKNNPKMFLGSACKQSGWSDNYWHFVQHSVHWQHANESCTDPATTTPSMQLIPINKWLILWRDFYLCTFFVGVQQWCQSYDKFCKISSAMPKILQNRFLKGIKNDIKPSQVGINQSRTVCQHTLKNYVGFINCFWWITHELQPPRSLEICANFCCGITWDN